MTTFLPKEVVKSLESARKKSLRKQSRLRIRVGSEILTILKDWGTGF